MRLLLTMRSRTAIITIIDIIENNNWYHEIGKKHLLRENSAKNLLSRALLLSQTAIVHHS